MRLITTDTLESGNVLAVPVYTSSNKVVLNAGVVFNDSMINRLKQMKIHRVYIEDDRFDDVEIVESIDIKTKNSASQVIKDAYENLHRNRGVDEYLIKGTAREIVDYVQSIRDHTANILSTSSKDDYIIEHSINVAVLSAFMGQHLNFNYNQLCDLATGALIHDLSRENTSAENPEHVVKGFNTMRNCRAFSLHSTIVCYEHHENYDGSGYPRNLKGADISIFSRIVRAADYFDNILNGYENNSKPMMPHQAYEDMLAVSGTLLDPEMIEAFRDSITFYPNGCNVLLSNGLKGIVAKQNAGSPQRPIVVVYNDTGVIGGIDLLKTLTLSIKDTLM